MSSLGFIGEINSSKQYEWKIANFFSLSATKGYYYDSPSFTLGDTSWRLRIYPEGVNIASSGTLSLFLVNESDVPRQVSLAFHIKSADGTLFGSDWAHQYITKTSGYVSFYKRSVLEQMESGLVPSGILTIVCTLKLNQEEKESTVKSQKVEKVHEKKAQGPVDHKIFPEEESLRQDYKRVFLEGQNHDFILKVGDREFPVHRDILRARSRVFESMLSNDIKEENSGVIDVADCEPKAMEQLLLYVYCGKIDSLDESNMIGLYYASNKYGMGGMKEEISDFLKMSLSPTNVCEIIQLALNHGDSSLLEFSTEYFCSNSHRILRTLEWQYFLKDNPTTANELLIKSIDVLRISKK